MVLPEKLSSFRPVTSSDFEFTKLWHEVHTLHHNLLFIPPRFEELDLNELEITGDINGKGLMGLFSSGSTGLPKLMIHSSEDLLENAIISKTAFPLSASSKVLILASPWHVAGLTWAIRCSIDAIDFNIRIPFVDQLPSIAEEMNDTHYTHLFTVPSALRIIGESLKNNFTYIAVGGAKVEPSDYSFIRRLTSTLIQAYGQTEAGGLLSFYNAHFNAESTYNVEKISTNVGKAPIGIKISTKGTLSSPAKILAQTSTGLTKEAYDTGDVGYFDENNDLHITGRSIPKEGNCNSLTGITMVAHK